MPIKKDGPAPAPEMTLKFYLDEDPLCVSEVRMVINKRHGKFVRDLTCICDDFMDTDWCVHCELTMLDFDEAGRFVLVTSDEMSGNLTKEELEHDDEYLFGGKHTDATRMRQQVLFCSHIEVIPSAG